FQTPQKYFYVGDNLSHTTALTKLMWNVVNPNSTVEADFDNADAWLSSIAFSLVIAHGKVHLLEDESYRPYLTSAYVEAVTTPPFELHLLRSLPDEL
ncbi:MAG: dienelactone hydrolase, partial [Cyanobacteria bacterium J06634_6]